jgi:hypothetical protein
MAFVLGQSVLGTEALGADIPISQKWAVRIVAGGVDITQNLTGEISIDAEERLARTASFSYFPNTAMDGTLIIDPDSWVGQPCTIQYDNGVTGLQTLFTGRINLGQYDPITRIATIDASDLLQELFEGTADTEAVLALIPTGRYSEAVFNVRDNGWEQAEDVMSTTPYDVHLDRHGNLQNVPWAIGSVAQTFDASSVVHNSVTFNNLRRRDLVNEVRVTYQYRFNRLKERTHSFSWQPGAGDYTDSAPAGGAFCDFLLDPYHLPTRDIIESAARGGGWVVGGIHFASVPPPMWFLCQNDGPGTRPFAIGWTTREEAAAMLAIGARWKAYKRWSQNITEFYNIVIKSMASQAKYGVLVYEDAASFTSERDTSVWTSLENEEVSTSGATLFDPEDPEGLEGVKFKTDALGDKYADLTEESIRSNDLDTFIAHGRTRILDVHRRNYVEWISPLIPTRDLRDTLRINYITVDATGKLFKLRHTMNLTTGSATSTFTIAISRGGGGPDDGIPAIARLDSLPTHDAPKDYTNLKTYVGGYESDPPYDETWQGWITNHADVQVWQEAPGPDYVPPGDQPPEGSSTVYISNDDFRWRGAVEADNSNSYPSSFRVETPIIEEETTNDPEPGKGGTPITVNVSVPQDPIVYKA